MDWVIDKNRPICPQLCEQLCVQIAKERFAPNEKIPSVREIAVEAGVNPNTVQRSLEELERNGVLYSVRGSGWFVCEALGQARDVLAHIVAQKTADYFAVMQILGMEAPTVKEYIKEWKV